MHRESGDAHPLLITTIVLAVLTVGLSGFGVWAFVNYQEQKNNVDSIVVSAVDDAKKAQIDADQASFAEQEKLPTRQIIGPTDLGKVTFSYPKTWSVYIDRDGTGANGTYEAYFYPGAVPPLSKETPYALRTTITSAKYETVLATFNERLKTGKLKASPVTVSDVDGTRLDGEFSDTVRGSMVILKIRDKTLQIYTQAESFKADFDTYILKTIEFNK
ncbi:MAG TPA: hypothetical protein VM581_02545 [Magnetospirillaceae bacterium]|nr:hypothetical protein [Magnetospirillaceae bacterium]